MAAVRIRSRLQHGSDDSWADWSHGTGGGPEQHQSSCHPDSAAALADECEQRQHDWAASQNAWYPINFYDTREGEPRDDATIGCTVNGIMNAVEIDIGNL